MNRVSQFIPRLLFIFGIALIVINCVGLFTSMRNDDIYTETGTDFKDDISLTADQVFAVIDSDTGNVKDYAVRVNTAVNQGIAHYWAVEGADKYALRIPIQENYLLFIASFLLPEKYQRYELLDYRKAIERGVGVCSEHALIFAEALYQRGIKTRMINLTGHIVTTALVDEPANEWWVFDPDYGVVIPKSLEQIEKDPKIVVSYYADHGYGNETTLFMKDVYEKDGNDIIPGFGIGVYSEKTRIAEYFSYVLIWIIPIFIMLPFALQVFRPKKRNDRFVE